MISLLKGSVGLLVQITLAACAPVIAYRRCEATSQRWRVIGIHVVAVIAGLIGLFVCQNYFRLDGLVRSSLPVVRFTWLPLVGTLLYATAWTSWFVAKTFRMPAEKPLERNVASVLQNSLDRFSRAGIDITETPLFLVLGSPAGGIRDFFAASHTDLAVLPVAEEENDPIQVCGNRDAIYVCCREASLLGNFTNRLALSRKRQNSVATTISENTAVSQEPAHDWHESDAVSASTSTNVQQLGGVATTVVATPTKSQAKPKVENATVGRVQETLEHLETLTGREETSASNAVLQPSTMKLPFVCLEPSNAEEILIRLDGLCREIAEIRQPYCPINGVVMMIPLAATETIEMADHVGMRIERDLQTVAEATESSISVQAIFCDLEHCEGSDAFLERFPETQRHRRLGAILPAPPASESDAGPVGIDKAVNWICHDLFPPLGCRLMSRDLQDYSNDSAARQRNRSIHTLVDAMRRRRDGMSRMLRRAIASNAGRVRIRGCFVAATGAAGESKRGFAEGIVPLILDMQNEVQWTSERHNRDAWQQRAAAAIYATILATAGLTVLLIFNMN